MDMPEFRSYSNTHILMEKVRSQGKGEFVEALNHMKTLIEQNREFVNFEHMQ
jgi:hypothetical protein